MRNQNILNEEATEAGLGDASDNRMDRSETWVPIIQVGVKTRIPQI